MPARVWLRIGNEMRAEASWPPDVASTPGTCPSRNEDSPTSEGDDAFEVSTRASPSARITVSLAANDPMNPRKAKLARRHGRTGRPGARNVRLVEDLRDSRRRIVTAQDERARALERNIHDGAQQQLVALTVKLRPGASGLLERDPGEGTDMLGGAARPRRTTTLETCATSRAASTRRCWPTRAGRPPWRPRRGSRRARRPSPDGVGRYGQEVEAAVYFCCLEALNNVAKYAEASSVEIRLAGPTGELRSRSPTTARGSSPADDTGPASRGSRTGSTRWEARLGRPDAHPVMGTTLVGQVPSVGRGQP